MFLNRGATAILSILFRLVPKLGNHGRILRQKERLGLSSGNRLSRFKKGVQGRSSFQARRDQERTALVNRFGVDAETAGALFFHGKGDTLFYNTPFATVTRAMNLLVKKAIAEKP